MRPDGDRPKAKARRKPKQEKETGTMQDTQPRWMIEGTPAYRAHRAFCGCYDEADLLDYIRAALGGDDLDGVWRPADSFTLAEAIGAAEAILADQT